MKLRTLLATLVALLTMAGVAYAAGTFDQVKAGRYDPAKTYLVQAKWLDGIGCPTAAKVATYPSTTPTGTYTDPACTTGDAGDQRNAGLLLAKTGPSSNNTSGVAELKGVEGVTLTELGYDIRKASTTTDPRGSHCGGGAPRFNITTTTGSYFLACNSPAPTTHTAGNGWLRLRWGGSAGTLVAYLNGTTLTAVTGTVKSISIIFDEGQDAAPDNFGLAVLDNIDVNGTLVGDAHKDRVKHDDNRGKGPGKDDGDDDSDD
jgi:hypothetical protein